MSETKYRHHDTINLLQKSQRETENKEIKILKKKTHHYKIDTFFPFSFNFFLFQLSQLHSTVKSNSSKMDNNTTPSNLNAAKNKAMGNVKDTAGNMMNDRSMQAEGKGQHAGGKTEEMGAKANDMWQVIKKKMIRIFYY